MEKKGLYHIITLSSECGWDEKPEAQTLSEAIILAKECLAEGDDEVKIYHRHKLKRYFFKNRQGKVINVPQKELSLLQTSWETREHAPQATGMPQISTQTADVENVSAEGESTAESAEMEPYNTKYYFDKYNGDWHKALHEYESAIDAIRDELFNYRMEPRKGGRYRTERIAELKRKLEALGMESIAVCRAIQQYTQGIAPAPPETSPAKDLSTEAEKTQQGANKGANPISSELVA